jgi:hypothetical protein
MHACLSGDSTLGTTDNHTRLDVLSSGFVLRANAMDAPSCSQHAPCSLSSIEQRSWLWLLAAHSSPVKGIDPSEAVSVAACLHHLATRINKKASCRNHQSAQTIPRKLWLRHVFKTDEAMQAQRQPKAGRGFMGSRTHAESY